MKLRPIANYASIAAVAAFLPLANLSSHAASNPSQLNADGAALQQAQPKRVDWSDEKRRKLRRAYWLLEGADRDYKGHRGKAMEEIKKAAKFMDLDLHGDGYGGVRQPWSNERLHEAKKALEDIVDTHHEHEHEHIWKAIQEIDRALEVG
jgi:hypothetical protein